jgi:hypothetical protein
VPEVGDQIQVAAMKVNQATRSGIVTDVRGRMITVQWATGDQSVFVPAPGTLTVLGRAATRTRSTAGRARKSRGAKGAISARPSMTATKATTRKAPVRKPAKKGGAKATTRKAPVRKPAKQGASKATARKAPVHKTTKRRTTQRRTTVTKKAGQAR